MTTNFGAKFLSLFHVLSALEKSFQLSNVSFHSIYSSFNHSRAARCQTIELNPLSRDTHCWEAVGRMHKQIKSNENMDFINWK